MSNRCTSRARQLSSAGTPSRHHLELQDRRDYTPADRAARTCWLGCPGSCTIWRPETQNSAFLLYPLHGRLLQDPTSLVQRSSKVQNPAPSARFSRKQSVVSSYQKVKNIRHNFIPLSPGLPQDFVAENKDNKLNTKKKSRIEHKRSNKIKTLKEIEANQMKRM
ncbi:hypothetical protein TNCV_1204371 [Trichonephila clavipes]|nr:hypothetical protein TNCV_1204371 [Trichonephila clavipes]